MQINFICIWGTPHQKEDLNKEKKETQYDSIETISNLFIGSRDYPCHAENIRSKNQSQRNQPAIIRPTTAPFHKRWEMKQTERGKEKVYTRIRTRGGSRNENPCWEGECGLTRGVETPTRILFIPIDMQNICICDPYIHMIYLLSHAKSEQHYGDKNMRANVFRMCT